MIKYEIGKKFPHDKYLNRGELTIAILNENFFDVFISLYSLTTDEIKAFKSGNLKVYLFTKDNIPFILFSNKFSFDISIDLTKLNEQQQKNWLSNKANTINLFLVNAENNTIAAMRMIAIDFATDIRDICAKQITMQNIDFKIQQILHLISINEMIEKAIKNNIF